MVHGAAGQGPAVLRSEAIACQQGGGIVALSAWMTEGVTMKVCVEDANGVQSDCEPLLRGQGPAYVAPIKGDFQNAKIVVIAENWGQGGMAAVDDIEYIGTMCNGQSDSGLMIGGSNTEVIPYTGAPIAPIESNADLACTVDTPDACQWGDPDPTHQWFWVDNVDASKLNQLTGTSVVPTSGAAYYEFPGENEFTFLGSDEMYCLQSDGDLVFSVWSTAGVQVEVCAVMYQWVNENGDQTGKEVCKPPVSVQSPGPAAFPFTVAEIENEPFVFVITAYTATTPAFIMIDNIAFTGQICTEKPVATPPPVSNDEQSCETLSTSFNSNTAIPAGWKNCESGCPDNAQMAKWFPTSDVLGHHNIRVRGATGAIKPHLGASLHQQLDSSGKDIGHGIAVLQSLDVKFTTPRLMSFSYQRGTFGSQLYVCRNAVPSLVRRDIPLFHESCKKIAGPNMYAAEWINGGQGTFLIEPTDERLYFVFSAPWKYSYGDAHCLIDDILIHEGTTADTPPLCLPLN